MTRLSHTASRLPSPTPIRRVSDVQPGSAREIEAQRVWEYAS